MPWPAGTLLRRTAGGISYAIGRVGGNGECVASTRSTARGGTSQPPCVRVVLTHAAGFCKEVWGPVLVDMARILGEVTTHRTNQRVATTTAVATGTTCAHSSPTMTDHHPLPPLAVEWLALDFSGHGASCSPPPEPARWDDYHVQETVDVMVDAGWKGASATSTPLSDDVMHTTHPNVVIGVGHSMGGAVLTTLELSSKHSRLGGTLNHVIAVEPPLFTRGLAWVAKAVSNLGVNPLANAAARRRRIWPDRQAVRQHVATRSPSNRWDPHTIDAWVSSGFREGVGAAAGRVVLCCTPETEARLLMWPGTPLSELSSLQTTTPINARNNAPPSTQGHTTSRGQKDSTERVSSNAHRLVGITLVTCAESTFSPLGIAGTGQA
jgi:pimeloyl-ACP methyl ester carboxylesterase